MKRARRVWSELERKIGCRDAVSGGVEVGRSGRGGGSGMDGGGCKGHGAKISGGSSKEERAETKATMSQGQAKLGKCTRRQLRKVEFCAKSGEDDGVEVGAGGSCEQGGRVRAR